MIPTALAAALAAMKINLKLEIDCAFTDLESKLGEALAARSAGDHGAARILLNEALDIEHAVTGDCALLGDLAEEWGVDYERDQR